MTSKKNQTYAQISIDQPVQYRIRIKGELDEHMSERLSGMQISHQMKKDGSIVSTLEGQLIDQAALFGVLVTLYNMRLPLISVECTDNENYDGNPLIKVRIEQKTDYLLFTVIGEEATLQYHEPLETVLNSCELAGIYRILVDYRGLARGNGEYSGVEYTRGTGQLYQEYRASGGTPLKIAVVGREGAVGVWKQNEMIAREYGMETFVTDDYEEAIAWLRSEKKDQ